MSACQSNMLSRLQSAFGSLIYELQIIWDEIGESDDERERMLLELEQECSEVFRRKVDHANRSRAQMRLAIADAQAELAAICSAIGELPVHIRQSDHNTQSLKAELRMILPQIEEMRKRKNARKNQVSEVQTQMQSIKNEMCSLDGFSSNEPTTDEADLSVKKLEELHKDLQALQKEKSKRLKMTLDRLNSLHSLCVVLGLDFKKVVNKIHPSLGEAESSKNISNSTIELLGTAMQQLRELKLQRMQQLQDLTTSLLELWNLMDTPIEEQQIFQKVTCKLAASEDEITEPDILSTGYINYVAAEVSRLEELKASKMKELVLKKKAELEAICRKTHLIPETDSGMEIAVHAIESGSVDAACVLDEIELKIARAKEEALSRKEILEKVQKWTAACEEERWLEKYNRDDNRYNAGRGAHLTLKHAEKARALVNKLPAMADSLASKILAWENERGIEFIYDGVRLLTMLEGYKVQRKEKELQRKRQRDQKKHQGQLLTEQEALYGSKPSPIKNSNVKKAPRLSYGATNRKVSLGTPMPQTLGTPAVSLGTPMPQTHATPAAKVTPNIRTANKNECINQNRRKDDKPAASSSGQRRGLSLGGIAAKQPASKLSNAHEAKPSMVRKPFSPISSTTPSKSPAANNMDDLNRKHNELWQKLLTINRTPPKIMSRAGQGITTPQKTPTTVPLTPSTASIPTQASITPASIKATTINRTPPKIVSRTGQENRTPQKTPTTVPLTPSTASIPMQTAITSASIKTTAIVPAPSATKSAEEEIEYSFEERRARYVLPRSPLMNVARV